MRQSALLRDALETPAFIVRPGAIEASRDELARICGLAGCRALYSLKALGLPDVLRLMVPRLAGFSASSLYEALLVRRVVGPHAEVQVTLPGLRERDCAELAGHCDAISFNSLSQSARLGGHFSHMRRGLRINPQISWINDERYDPCRKGSKLGEPVGNLRWLKALPPGIAGIHFHTTCEADDFSSLKPTIERLQCEIPHILAEISWINLGGGHGWRAPGAAGQLIEATALLRSTAIDDVYIEPGAAIVRDGGTFVASVVDLIDADGGTVAVLDTSVNHMPEVFEYSDLPGIEPEVLGHRDDLPAGEGFAYVLAGSTCLAGDLFGTYRFTEPLAIGSRVEFPAMGAYSLVKAHMFNGQPLPNIYLERGDGTVVLRRAASFRDFADLNHMAGDGSIGDISPSSDNEEGLVDAISTRSRYGSPCQARAIGSCRTSRPISARTFPPTPCRCASPPPERAKATSIARSASSPAWRTTTRRGRARYWIFVLARTRAASGSRQC